MTRPRRSRSMPLDARLATRHEPARFVCTTVAKSSSDIRMISWSRVTPAFATRTSTGPWAASTSVEGRVDRGRVGDVATHPGQPLRRLAGAVGHGDAVAAGRAARARSPARCPGCRRSPAPSAPPAAAWSARSREATLSAAGAGPTPTPPRGTGSRSAYPPALGSAPMRAIQVSRFGGPEVLEVVDLPVPEPDSPRLLLDVEAAGINYADTHQVADDYLAPQTLPFVPGAEVVGRDADGRRVVALVTGGGYAEQALAHPATTFALPDEVDDTTALAFVLQGTTAWHLLQHQRPLRAGRVGRRPRRGRRRRQPCRAAGPGVGSQPGHRDGVLDGEARPGPRPRRGRRTGPRAGRGRPHRPAGRDPRGQRRPSRRHRAGDRGRPGVRRVAVGPGAVRPAGDLRHGLARRRRPRSQPAG